MWLQSVQGRFRLVRQEFYASAAEVVLFLDMGMLSGLLVHMVQKCCRSIPLTAPFTSFQGEGSDDAVLYGNGSDIVRIRYLNQLGRAEVGTGAAPDAMPGFCRNIGFPFGFFHSQGLGADNLVADTDAQAAFDTSVRWRLHVYAKV